MCEHYSAATEVEKHILSDRVTTLPSLTGVSIVVRAIAVCLLIFTHPSGGNLAYLAFLQSLSQKIGAD